MASPTDTCGPIAILATASCPVSETRAAINATIIQGPGGGKASAGELGMTTLRTRPGRTRSANATAPINLPSRASTSLVSSHACEIDNFVIHGPRCCLPALCGGGPPGATLLAADARQSHVARRDNRRWHRMAGIGAPSPL